MCVCVFMRVGVLICVCGVKWVECSLSMETVNPVRGYPNLGNLENRPLFAQAFLLNYKPFHNYEFHEYGSVLLEPNQLVSWIKCILLFILLWDFS